MIYYRGDFTLNTTAVLELIKNLCEDVTVTVDPKGFSLEGESPKFYMSDMKDLKRLQNFLQKYFSITNVKLFDRVGHAEMDPETGRVHRTYHVPNLMLEDVVLDTGVDYATPNYNEYITALKNSSRYDATAKTLDHVPPKTLFKKLCMFRFLYKYYFGLGLSPMAVDRFYFLFKEAFCPNEKSDSEGMVDAIHYIAKFYHIHLAKSDVMLRSLKSDSVNIAALRRQREALCQSLLESEDTVSEKGRIFQQYSQMMIRRDSYARDILEGIATIYALGFEKTYEEHPSLHYILDCVKNENRDIRAHGERNFSQIFSPVYYNYSSTDECTLKDYYNPRDFFLIMQHILTRCHALRRQWNRQKCGRFKRWLHDFQFGKTAEAFINILNRSLGNLTHPTPGQRFNYFREGQFRQRAYSILTHCYDHHNEYRRAFEVVLQLEQEYNTARAGVGVASHKVVVIDGELNRAICKLERNLNEVALEMSSRIQMQLREKVMRKLTVKRQQSMSKPPKLPPRDYKKRQSSVRFKLPSLGDRPPLSRELSVFSEGDVFTPTLEESSLPLGRKRSQAFALKRSFSSITDDPTHSEPIPEEIDEDYEFAQHFTGNDDDDFATALRLIMLDNGNYAKLIVLRQKLYKTQLAREVKVSDHMLWTGTERRHCTRHWGHLERIIQILALTDMITRNLSLSKITRITNHYFFLITDRHPSLFIKKNQKKVCGMAARYFKYLRKNPPEYDAALDMLDEKWRRYVELYNLTPMNKLEVLQAGRGELGRGALPSIEEEEKGH